MLCLWYLLSWCTTIVSRVMGWRGAPGRGAKGPPKWRTYSGVVAGGWRFPFCPLHVKFEEKNTQIRAPIDIIWCYIMLQAAFSSLYSFYNTIWQEWHWLSSGSRPPFVALLAFGTSGPQTCHYPRVCSPLWGLRPLRRSAPPTWQSKQGLYLSLMKTITW